MQTVQKVVDDPDEREIEEAKAIALLLLEIIGEKTNQ